jgi:hypothetical protein
MYMILDGVGLPIEVHSDTIRELAVSMTRHYLLSGGKIQHFVYTININL